MPSILFRVGNINLAGIEQGNGIVVPVFRKIAPAGIPQFEVKFVTVSVIFYGKVLMVFKCITYNIEGQDIEVMILTI